MKPILFSCWFIYFHSVIFLFVCVFINCQTDRPIFPCTFITVKFKCQKPSSRNWMIKLPFFVIVYHNFPTVTRSCSEIERTKVLKICTRAKTKPGQKFRIRSLLTLNFSRNDVLGELFTVVVISRNIVRPSSISVVSFKSIDIFMKRRARF